MLIPRPETEQLVELVLGLSHGVAGGVAVDVGTGSGAIALALAQEGPFARVIGTDIVTSATMAALANAFPDALSPTADVISADTIASARAALAAHRFDLAVIDIALAAGSGLDLLPDLRPPRLPDLCRAAPAAAREVVAA